MISQPSITGSSTNLPTVAGDLRYGRKPEPSRNIPDVAVITSAGNLSKDGETGPSDRNHTFGGKKRRLRLEETRRTETPRGTPAN